MTEILRRHAFSIAFVSLLIAFALFTGRGDETIHRFSGFTMGTSYDIQLVGIESGSMLSVIEEGSSALLGRLDKEVFSTYAPDSELSRFNRHPVGEPFPVSAELLEVLLLAREISELTDGAFDVTVGPLVNLWGFGPEIVPPARVPDEAAIAAALEQVGYAFVEVDADVRQATKRRDVYVDLSAIAKGYAVDKLAEYLESHGVQDYFLEVGGELKMSGLKPGGISWIPAIESPQIDEARIHEIFFSHGEALAVAGSGDYRNYFESEGVRYSHEIDPRSGKPVQHRLAAAYVVTDSVARADALATAMMIMGTQASKQLAEELDLAVYLISKDEQLGFVDYHSPAFARYLSEPL